MDIDHKELLKRFKPPVKKNADFTRYWKRFVLSVVTRDNFQEYHLKNLEILCTLYIEYDRMTEVIQEEGFSYWTSGRYGEQKKTLPELIERQKILAEIRQYSKLLGILLNRDTNLNESDDADKWD